MSLGYKITLVPIDNKSEYYRTSVGKSVKKNLQTSMSWHLFLTYEVKDAKNTVNPGKTLLSYFTERFYGGFNIRLFINDIELSATNIEHAIPIIDDIRTNYPDNIHVSLSVPNASSSSSSAAATAVTHSVASAAAEAPVESTGASGFAAAAPVITYEAAEAPVESTASRYAAASGFAAAATTVTDPLPIRTIGIRLHGSLVLNAKSYYETCVIPYHPLLALTVITAGVPGCTTQTSISKMVETILGAFDRNETPPYVSTDEFLQKKFPPLNVTIDGVNLRKVSDLLEGKHVFVSVSREPSNLSESKELGKELQRYCAASDEAPSIVIPYESYGKRYVNAFNTSSYVSRGKTERDISRSLKYYLSFDDDKTVTWPGVYDCMRQDVRLYGYEEAMISGAKDKGHIGINLGPIDEVLDTIMEHHAKDRGVGTFGYECRLRVLITCCGVSTIDPGSVVQNISRVISSGMASNEAITAAPFLYATVTTPRGITELTDIINRMANSALFYPSCGGSSAARAATTNNVILLPFNFKQLADIFMEYLKDTSTHGGKRQFRKRQFRKRTVTRRKKISKRRRSRRS